MNRHERRKRAIEKEQLELVDKYKAVWRKAEDEDREATEDERAEVEEALKGIETLNEEKVEVEANIKTVKRVDDLSKELGPVTEKSVGGVDAPNGMEGITVGRSVKSFGEQFTESEGYKSVVSNMKAGQSQRFSTGAVSLDMKGTLTESAGGGGGVYAAPAPQVLPGVQEKLFQRLSVADLLPHGQATTSSLRYVVEGTATSGAAGVAEGGLKPQSTLGFTTTDEPVKKIATTLVTSDEMIEDASQVQAYINGRLSLFVNIEEERQLLLGGGTNELEGITKRSGVNQWARGTVDNNAVALFKAINGTRGSSFLDPDAIIINPANWQTTRLLQDKNEQFYGGGPFSGPYGGSGNMAQLSGQNTGIVDHLWNLPVIVTTAIGAGTAVVGSFRQAAQVFTRGGLSVEATNSHEDYFAKNLVAIRAEKREALAVYRPAAFTVVSGLA